MRPFRTTFAALAAALVTCSPRRPRRGGRGRTRPPGVRIGIGDQKTEMFARPALRAASASATPASPSRGNALSPAWPRQELDQWMSAARAAGVEPLVAFGHSRAREPRRVLPIAGALSPTSSDLFRQRYPWVRDFATVERGQPLRRADVPSAPGGVGAYYEVHAGGVPRLPVLAAELLDLPNMDRWWQGVPRGAARADPRLWGLHNYRDANRRAAGRSDAQLPEARRTATSGLTETGGIVRVATRPRSTDLPESPDARRGRHALGLRPHRAAVARALHARLPLPLERVDAGAPPRWDSALVEPRQPRAARRSPSCGARSAARAQSSAPSSPGGPGARRPARARRAR